MPYEMFRKVRKFGKRELCTVAVLAAAAATFAGCVDLSVYALVAHAASDERPPPVDDIQTGDTGANAALDLHG